MRSLDQSVAPHVHLSPGHLIVTGEPRVVTTVLGSCVAVTLYDPVTSLAGICHAMLAKPQHTVAAEVEGNLRYRYACYAVPALIAAFRRAGVPFDRVQVKLFGGGNVIQQACPSSTPSIGSANVEASREILLRASLQVAAESTGGDRGRKLVFNTANGEVLLKYLRRGLA